VDASESRSLDRGWNCRLTTTGRKSGKPRAVTIWYVFADGTLYLTGGAERPQWCRNLAANGEAEFRICGRRFRGRARIAEEDADAIRERFVKKYLMARISRLFGGYTRSVPAVVQAVEELA
jgi:deazaflavin-dependent oxidoreductase (nitroreductase family)